VFETYNAQSLINIVTSRVSCSVIHPKTVEFLAKKVAATSGDARAIIELIYSSILACERELSYAILDGPMKEAVVTPRHAMIVIRQSNVWYTDMIEHLPTFQKLALLVGVNLARLVGQKPMNLGLLRQHLMLILDLDQSYEDSLSIEDFKFLIETLVDSHLLCLKEFDGDSLSSRSYQHLSQVPITFELQLEDVESAIESTIVNDDKYKRLVNKMKSMIV
jgi:Cdc6-like AAA superfamily ATPase